MLTFLARTWFPLTLVGLFLAAIPGVVLVILALLGMDGQVNVWLEDNFQITYHLALTQWLVLVLLFLPLAIILLYFLKLKRKPLQVPSTFLWRKSIEDLHVNSLLQWLRQNLLLVLQLLALLFLIYAVLGLRFHGSTRQAMHYIVLIDNSASMAATDVKPTRLQFAKQAALKLIEGASDQDNGMVIVFNSKATTMQAYTNNRAKLRDAVRNIEQTSRPTRLEEALTLIDGLANPIRSTEDTAVRPDQEKPGEERTFVKPQGISTTVHLFSDGRHARIAESTLANLNSRQAGNTSLLGNITLQYHRMGKNEPGNANNVGIVSFNAVRTGQKDKKQATPRLEALVRLHNFSKEAATVTLRLDVLVEGKLAHTDQQTLELGPRIFRGPHPEEDRDDDTPGEIKKGEGSRGGIFVLPPLDLQSNIVLHAYLDKAKDDFPLDDQAWFVVGTIRKAKVLIVGPGNPVLEAFFDQEATRKFATYQRLKAEELATDGYRKLARSGTVDLVIFDRCAPEDEADMPLANTFFIDRPPPPWQRGSKSLKNPYLILSRTNSLLLRHITSLWDIGVADGFVFDLEKNLDDKVRQRFQLPDTDPNRRTMPSLTRLIEASGAVPVIFTLPRDPYTDLVMTFPLVTGQGDLNTNWPLQPSFPLFLLNILHNLGNVDDAVRTVTVQPGEPMVLRPEAGVQKIAITSPMGTTTHLERGSRADFTYTDTEHLGVYQMVREEKDGAVEEKDSASERRFLAVNLLDSNESAIDPREQVRIGSDNIEAGQKEIFQPRELWKWILLVALALLVAEWLFYNRRVSL
jgi:hypothetical protein